MTNQNASESSDILQYSPAKNVLVFSFKDVLKGLPKRSCRTKASGVWPYDPVQLMRDLLGGDASISDPEMQAVFFDWMEASDYNKFYNKETGEYVYAQVAKRGNQPYALRKAKKRDDIQAALDGKEFDVPIDGFRNRRMTRLLFVTLSFDRERFTPEEAWGALRATSPEGVECAHGPLNRFKANLRKIFGSFGCITCKEGQSSGYPAPHMILLLDEPVMVERRTGKSGTVSWRLCDPRILDRLGKGPLMRRLSKTDYRKAISMNPVWKHGFMDVEGIVSSDRFKSRKNSISYVFKYLTKCFTINGSSTISDFPDINSISDTRLRTALYTLMANKCFRTRDLVISKGFKDRIGLLPGPSEEGESKWVRLRTYTELEYYLNTRIDELRQWESGAQRMRALMAQGGPCRGIPSSTA